MQRTKRFLIALCLFGLLAGCATNRGYMKLDLPSTAQPTNPSAGKAVVIDAVQDLRQFQDSPSDPSIPSLKKGDQYKLDSGERKRAIARKRNGFGKAIGDILLDGDQTVETLTRGIVEQGFARHGYHVIPANTSAPADAIHVKVNISEFWAWFTPGFWTVDMEAKIRTVLKFSGPAGEKEVDVAAYGKKSAPTGREDNWREAYQRAFEDYATKFDQSMGTVGL